MKAYILACFCLSIVSSCHAFPDSVQSKVDYPTEIVNLGLQAKYDKAKWHLYCIHCDEELKFIDTSNKAKVTFGTLPLRFDHVEIYNDSIEIDFFFYYQNKRLDRRIVANYITWGAVFVGTSDSIELYSARDVRYFWKKCDPRDTLCPYREVKPLQPEVIKYINENKDKLDPWFRKEAIKRGVINE